MLLVSDDIEDLLNQMKNYVAPTIESGLLQKRLKDKNNT
jgi:hypothetical protein